MSSGKPRHNRLESLLKHVALDSSHAEKETPVIVIVTFLKDGSKSVLVNLFSWA